MHFEVERTLGGDATFDEPDDPFAGMFTDTDGILQNAAVLTVGAEAMRLTATVP